MYNRYTEEQELLTVQLRKQGLTYSEIAIKTGIKNLTTIQNFCKKAGIATKIRINKKIKYVKGLRFFNIVTIEPAPTKISKTGIRYSCWKCLCDCGKEFIATCKEMSKGVRKSCGCLSKNNRFKTKDTKLVIAKIKLDHYRSAAKRRNIEWSLTLDEFMSMIYENCFYCGLPPYILVKRGVHALKVNGVDRMDNNLDYFLSNCVPCCKFCNCAKGDSTKEEFLNWIKRIKLYENRMY